MYNASIDLRFRAVRSYLESGDSLRKTAAQCHVHYQSVYKWVKLYKEKGEAGLSATYKRPWNRAEKRLEDKVMFLKENNPTITVREAKKLLAREGITISRNGIWSIWKRYGFAGFIKENMGNDFTEYGLWSKEAKCKLLQAEKLYELGKLKKSADILNTIPFLPKNGLITKVPDKLLNLRRRIEKIYRLFGSVSLISYSETTHLLYTECKRQKLNYSALRAGLPKAAALSWSGMYKERLTWTEELKKNLNKKTSKRQTSLLFALHLSLLISEGLSVAGSLEIKKAFQIAGNCRRLLTRRKHTYPYFLLDLAVLYITLDDFRKAEKLIYQAINKVDEAKRRRLKSTLAVYVHLIRGELQKGARLLKEAEAYEWTRHAHILRFRSLFTLLKGMPSKTIELATEALRRSRKEELHQDIANSYLAIASAYCSLGEKAKAHRILARLLPFLAKSKMKRFVIIYKFLLDKKCDLSDALLLSTIKLAWILKHENFQKAFNYARIKGIHFFFYRYLLFFPETVQDRIERGKPLGLPKTILKLPVFNKQNIVFHIKFLGEVVIYRNQKHIKIKLTPKEKAFLIHCALRAQEPGKTVALESIYRNFWPRSKNPARNLSHLLVKLKKASRIPVHLLEIKTARGNPVLINKGIYFTTDYSEFTQNLAKAKALERAEEWATAEKEYLEAFNIFRGRPSKKRYPSPSLMGRMYDNWSEQLRRVILNRLETEAIHFAKQSLAHKNKTDARKVLEKVTKVVPHSEESIGILQTL